MDQRTKENMKEFLSKCNKIGFEDAYNEFIKDNSDYKNKFLRIFFNQSIDPIFHGFKKNNQKCLYLSSEFDVGLETLSNIYNEIYFSGNNETKQIIDTRLKFSEKENIILSSELNKIFEKKETFDLIYSQNLIKFLENTNIKKNNIHEFFEKIFNSININGCFCFGLKFNELLENFNDEIPITKNTTKEVQLEEVKKMIVSKGFKVDIYWVLPSIEKPYYSSNMLNEIPLIWYVKNLRQFVKEEKLDTKQKAAAILKGRIGEKIIKSKMKTRLNQFIFCCYKDDKKNTLEDIIEKQTGERNILMISRPKKINFITFKNKEPDKIIKFSKFGNIFPTKISNHIRTFENMKNPTDRMWMEKWHNGNKLNMSKEKEILLAIDWLINFQKKTQGKTYSRKEVEKESNEIFNKLLEIGLSSEKIVEKWLKDYNEFVSKNKIFQTSVHGDFWIDNILITKNNQINVIDWELYLEEGNPFTDLMKFMMGWLMKSNSNNIDAKIFEKKIMGFGNFIKIYPKIRDKINEHFKCEFEFMVVLRYCFLWRISKAKITEENLKSYSSIIKILSTKNILE
jgi:thiamine kinase-like enzyme